MKIAVAPVKRGTIVCHATTEESPCPISFTPRRKPCRRHFVPLHRYDLLVRKNKPEFSRADAEGAGGIAVALADAVRP